MRIVIIVFETKKMARKRSVIWDFFSVSKDTKYAICTTCQAEFQGVEVVQSLIQLQI